MSVLSLVNAVVGGSTAYVILSERFEIRQSYLFGRSLGLFIISIFDLLSASLAGTLSMLGIAAETISTKSLLCYLIIGSCMNAALFRQAGAPKVVLAYTLSTIIGLIFWPLSLVTMIICLLAFWNEESGNWNKWIELSGSQVYSAGSISYVRDRFEHGRTIVERLVTSEPRRHRLIRALSHWCAEILGSVWLCLLLFVINFALLRLFR